MSTKIISPAERARQALKDAERIAYLEDWEEYRALEEAHRVERFNIKTFEHGTHNGYQHYRCRCTECKRAHSDYMREYYRRKRAENPLPPRPATPTVRKVQSDQHGTVTGYTYGCRCTECKEAKRDSRKQWEHGTEYTYRKHRCRCGRCKEAASRARRSREQVARQRDEEENIILPVPHGTRRGYNYFGCRCDGCRTAHNAHTDYYRKKRAKFYQENPDKIPERVHGTANGYNHMKCRCDRCTKAHTDYLRDYRKRKRARDEESRAVSNN